MAVPRPHQPEMAFVHAFAPPKSTPLHASPDSLPTKPAPSAIITHYQYRTHHPLQSDSQFSSSEARDARTASSTAASSFTAAHPTSQTTRYADSLASGKSADQFDKEGRSRWSSVGSAGVDLEPAGRIRGGADPSVVDNEKAAYASEQNHTNQHRRAPPPPPLAQPAPTPSRSARQSAYTNTDYVTRIYDDDDLVEDMSPRLVEKALPILVYLSFLLPLYSIVSSLYTLAILLLTILIFPARLFLSLTPISHAIPNSLAPLHRLHLRKIYASVFPPSSSSSAADIYAPIPLVCVLLASPILSLGIMVASWVAASFWFYAAILGDPDGSGKGNDGARTVLMVRGWWVGVLMRAVRRS